jgi:cell division protein FtsA
MAQHIRVGIDIGTYQIKVAVAEHSSVDRSSAQDQKNQKSTRMPRILGVGFAESKGMRHGYIINLADVGRSVRIAVNQAEKASGIKIKKAFLSIGGMGLNAVVGHGSTVISRADSEITDLDINKAIAASENEIAKPLIMNRKILHTVPLEYKIDGKPALGRPEGMKGVKLEVKTLFITCLEHHINDIIQAVEEADIRVEDVIASPLAASLVTLTKLQKIAGCVLANIGAETVSIVVFENNLPISLEVFPIGSTDITNDIALGLKVPIEEAENIKIGMPGDESYSRKKLNEIIEARLSDIFELIDAHLKKIGRNGLLPAGIIITGGGSGLGKLDDFAKTSLRLPSRIASLNLSGNFKTPIKDATWAVAYGLCILGFSASEDDNSIRAGKIIVKDSWRRIGDWFKQFLP